MLLCEEAADLKNVDCGKSSLVLVWLLRGLRLEVQTMHIRNAGSMRNRNLWVALLVSISIALSNISKSAQLNLLTANNSNKIAQYPITTANVNKKASDSKPLLVLHVGPQKTGTTTIQMKLLGPRFVPALRKDNYTVVDFNYLQFGKLIADCFDLERDCNETGSWKTLIDLYHKSTISTNAVHSTESFSEVRTDPYTVRRFQSLREHFRIHVIVVYRRVHEWLLSQYHQHEKYKLYEPKAGGRWKGFDPKGPQRTSFVDFFEDFFPRMRDSYQVRNLYVKFFGNDAITVMPMPTDGSLLSEFFCHALPRANHTCAESRDLERRKGGSVVFNPSGHFLFEHDRLLENARDLIPGVLKRVRHTATVALEARLAQLNLTIRDMPQKCLSPQQEETLWKYALMTEQEIAPHPLGRDELYQSFQNSLWKFCSVDVTATLQNETWREVISSIGNASSAA